MAVGVFDGLHLGHHAIIQGMIGDSRKNEATSCVLTFLNHPLSLLAPAYCPKRLITPGQQLQLFKQTGIELLIRIKFDQDFARLTPEEFIEKILFRQLGARRIYCSADFHFGRNGKGNVDYLLHLGKKLGLEVMVLPPVVINGCVVSSTLIRELLLAGRVEQAQKMLGRPFGLQGRVIKGKGIGARILKCPTANLKVHSQLLIPANGVYAVVVLLNQRKYAGMMNIGTCPTFGEQKRSVEVHILDFNGDLLGKTLAVEFIARLRAERKFKSVPLLRRQIAIDEQHTRKVLQRIKF